MTEKNSECMLLVRTERFGTLEIESSKIIQIPSGLVGYGKPQIFVLLEYVAPFHWLQSVDDPSLAFVVLDGLEICKKFELVPPFGDPDTDLREDDEYAVILIVTLAEKISKSTANLLAPIFVNMRNRRGVQVVYDDDPSRVRYPIFELYELGENS
ncbi:MAG: flagellar assembly protein FliW [Deltaproteobacteria bacterium]|nr:flagellar assembly protein FliW [Deltaproteobacteria bacterium]